MEYEDVKSCGSNTTEIILEGIGVALVVFILAFLSICNMNNNRKIKDLTMGCTEIDYCYDYVDEDNYEIIKPSKTKALYMDDFGKVYAVSYSRKGLNVTFEKAEIKSKHENGVILAVDSDRIICSCDAEECPHQKLCRKD